jgi:predicted transcriptional regulator
MKDKTNTHALTASIIISYASKNHLRPDELLGVITAVFRTLTGLSSELGSNSPPDVAAPVISLRKSVTSEYIFCLICGKRLKSMKLHIRANHQLHEDEYRRMWSLPKDYPMVSPNYSARRSELAKKNGLGQKR